MIDREAWCAAIHGVTKSRTWLSDWTELNTDTSLSPKVCSLHYGSLGAVRLMGLDKCIMICTHRCSIILVNFIALKTLCARSLSFPHLATTDLFTISLVVQSLSRFWLFATPLTAVCQASLSFTISWSLLKLMSIESVMLSNHLILCRPLLLLPSIFHSIRVFSNAKNWFFALDGQSIIEV